MSGKSLFIEDTALGDVVALGPSLSKGGSRTNEFQLCSLPFPALFIIQTLHGIDINVIRNK